MAGDYKRAYEEMRKMVSMYQDKLVPKALERIECLMKNQIAVRCADCQHCALEYKEPNFGEPSKYVRVCLLHDHETTLDDYCSRGESKWGDTK